ncbi:MAG: TolC family protein [Balneolaceae bacterium]
MKKIILFALLVFLTYSSSALGQTVQTITLQEAIEIALENNYQLKQAENNLTLSEDRIKSEYADFLPNLNAGMTGRRSTGNQFNNNTGDFVNRTLFSFGASLSTGITIFGGFENINSLRSAEQNKISSEESLKRAKESIIFSTATSYLQVLLSQELLEIAESNLETSTRQLEQIQAQVEVGSRPAVDLYNQESAVATDELAVTNQENSLSISKLSLVRQLQIDPLGEYEFVIPEINIEDASAKDYDLKLLVEEAIAGRSDLLSEQASIKALEYQKAITKSAILPSLTMSGSVSSDANDATLDPLTGDNALFGDQFFDRNVGTSISLSLNIPIFNNLDRSVNIQNSKIQFKNAELAYQNSELGVIQEVTQAHIDYISIVKQLDASNKALLASEKAFETQQERYNVGASTLIELSQAQANYVSAQSNSTQALYNLIFQEKLLDFYLGKLSGENIEF